MKSTSLLFMAPRRRAVLGLLAAGALGLGCGPHLEAEITQIDVTEHDVLIKGVPEPGLVPPMAEVKYEQRRVQSRLPRNNFTEVQAHALLVTTKAEGGDLSFIRHLRVTLTTPERDAAGEAPIQVALYDRPRGTTDTPEPPAGPLLAIPCDPPADLIPLWKGTSLRVALEVGGDLPLEDVLVDVSLRLSARLRYE